MPKSSDRAKLEYQLEVLTMAKDEYLAEYRKEAVAIRTALDQIVATAKMQEKIERMSPTEREAMAGLLKEDN